MRDEKGLGGYGIKGLMKKLLTQSLRVFYSRQGRQGRKAPTRYAKDVRHYA